ncbi:helix-turn-helix domain-containing protein [Piscinibacter gummiphilus]|uniref:helix-turn-helix domain-containing protein n=1 Tax=Piscinibacter gummiphilus TaxID=946333 RepID=UPI000A270BF6|nr:helix-turn-helix transcriptional regulator [Piscinibacter gummiphilus]ATU63324.1 XRE family transcriptional regulator [Piscinibacter gummiphilus]
MPWPSSKPSPNLRAVPRVPSPSASPAKRSTSFEPDVARLLGQVIRSAREVQGIAQDAFALRAGIDRSYYGKLERGERQPTVGLLLRIGRALEIPASELLAHLELNLRGSKPRRRQKP